ncbi:hypothetical protein, partial [Anaerofustis stercorihominis]|uniref:hypothetical protein n=1 Tax=Anaerofustis stercorihominis TaxID=214853 RepID=UPI001A9BFA35
VRGNKPFTENIYNYGLIYQSIIYLLATILGLAFISIMPNKKIPTITSIGQKTLQIYFWHIFVMNILTNIFNLDNILCTSPTGKLCYMIIAIITTFILSLKIFSFPTSLFINKK